MFDNRNDIVFRRRHQRWSGSRTTDRRAVQFLHLIHRNRVFERRLGKRRNVASTWDFLRPSSLKGRLLGYVSLDFSLKIHPRKRVLKRILNFQYFLRLFLMGNSPSRFRSSHGDLSPGFSRFVERLPRSFRDNQSLVRLGRGCPPWVCRVSDCLTNRGYVVLWQGSACGIGFLWERFLCDELFRDNFVKGEFGFC